MVCVEPDLDELEDPFPLVDNTFEGMNNVLWVAHFLFHLQRRHLFPDAVHSLMSAFFSVLFLVLVYPSNFVMQVAAMLVPYFMVCTGKLGIGIVPLLIM